MSYLRRLSRALPALLLAGVLAMSWGEALALEGEGFTLSDKTPKKNKTYGPIPGQNPGATATDPTVGQCNALPSEINIPITLQFRKEFGHLVQMRVYWEAPDANDVDIYLFDEAGELVTSSASSAMPEFVQLGSPDNGTYYLCVRNFSGPNTGFRVEAATRFLDVFVRPTPQPTPTPRPTPSAARRTPEPTVAAPVIAPITAEPVETPGADGPFSDKGLVRVAGERQAGEADSGLTGLEIGLGVLTGVIAVSGAVLVALRIRRDTTPV